VIIKSILHSDVFFDARREAAGTAERPERPELRLQLIEVCFSGQVSVCEMGMIVSVS
jgi:hypothetical protein